MLNDEYDVNPSNEADVIARLPEVTLLKNNIRSETVRLFVEDIPPYFWIARASGSYHPPDERGLGGLWLHTKRVFTAWTMIERSLRAMNVVDAVDAQSARAATLVHDAFKYGVTPASDGDDAHEYAGGTLSHLPSGTQTDHDVVTADLIESDYDFPPEVSACVRTHGGSPSWTVHEGPRPYDDLTLGHHFADLIASNQEHRLPVLRPSPTLEEMVGDEIPALSDEWEVE